MRIWKAIFSVLTIIFGSLGLINIVSTDITLPIMFVFMGLTMLTNASFSYLGQLHNYITLLIQPVRKFFRAGCSCFYSLFSL